MRNIFAAALVPFMAVLAFGCTSTTALKTSEPDDLYYSSSDRTVRQETFATTSGAGENTDQAGNPEYYDPAAASRSSVTNNYYYDNSRNFGSRGRRSVMMYNDPFYSPFGYSAAYCYGIYDPFCFPGYYPYSGLTVSIGYGWGNPWGHYGYRPYGAYGYGYRPYDMYGYGGLGFGGGGYYHGFYDGYYAGGGGYGYGYKRQNVQYGPRGDRSNVPATAAPGSGRSGSPGSPGRVGNTNSGGVYNDPGRVGRSTAAPAQSGGQPARVTTGQPAPGRAPRTADQPGRVSDGTTTPSRENIQPENYQFQNTERPSREPAKPVRGRDNVVPAQQPQPDRPAYQQERPVQQTAPAQQTAPVQQQRPTPEYSRPERPVQRESRPAPTYNNERSSPSYNSTPSRSSGGSAPSRSGGRPRN